MTKTLNLGPQIVGIWYLEDTPSDFEKFERDVVPPLKDLLERQMAADYAAAGVVSPGVRIMARGLTSVDDFVAGIYSLVAGDGGACAPTLILLDYFIAAENGELRPLAAYTVGESGEDFFTWLDRMLPSVPYRMLTSAQYDAGFQDKHIFKGDLDGDPDSLANELKEVLVGNRATFWLQLQEYAMRQVTSWHTPGHNKGTAFISSPVLRPFYEAYTQRTTPLVFSSDLSVSVSKLGDLSEPSGDNLMAQAMFRASTVFGSSRTYFCTNGTSTANKTLLMTILKPGEVVLVDRNCHKSIHQAIVMAGAVPYYLTPRFNSGLSLWYPLSQPDIKAALDDACSRGLRPRMLILTTCTYDGILFPVYEIARLAHDKGVLFYADEAWFPYGRFHPYYGAGPSGGRYNALDSGADFCVHSSHKALAAFSQASMIHVGKHFEELLGGATQSPGFEWLNRRFDDFREFEHRLVENLVFWLSTSPHYPMIATLDCASAQMYMEGLPAIGVLLKHARKLHGWAEENGCAVTKEDLTSTEKGYELYGHDPLRFMVKVKRGALEELQRHLLSIHRQQWEKSSQGSLLFLVTLGTSESDLNMLIQSLEQCKHLLGSANSEGDRIPQITGQVIILPRDAHYAGGRYMPLSEIRTYLSGTGNASDAGAGARIAVACHMVTPFPPGVPTIVPGLPVTDSSLEWIEGILEGGGEVHGIMGGTKDPQIRVLLDTDQELTNIRNSYKTDVELDRTLSGLSQTDDASQ